MHSVYVAEMSVVVTYHNVVLGVDFNFVGENKHSPLLFSIIRNKFDSTLILLENGAKVDNNDSKIIDELKKIHAQNKLRGVKYKFFLKVIKFLNDAGLSIN